MDALAETLQLWAFCLVAGLAGWSLFVLLIRVGYFVEVEEKDTPFGPLR